jgi:hypothetical protein
MLQSRSTDCVEAEAVVHRLRTIKRSLSEPSYELISESCSISGSDTSQNSTDETTEMSDKILEPSDVEEYELFQDIPPFFRYKPRYHGNHPTTQATVEDVANRTLNQG